MTTAATPLCPTCHSPAAAWQIDSPVRAHDRVTVDLSGLQLAGLHVPEEGLEPVDRPTITCLSCNAHTHDEPTRAAVLAAATAAARGESPRFDA
ncbi:MAG: hypothetical protein ABI555_04735 [Chloroflexota bacterium]